MLCRFLKSIVEAFRPEPVSYGYCLCSHCGRAVVKRNGRVVRHLDEGVLIACLGSGKPGKELQS